MYEMMTVEGLAVSYSHSALAAIGRNRRLQTPVQIVNEKLGQLRPMLEFGDANNGFESIPGHKEMGLFINEFTSQSSQGLASGLKTIGLSTGLPCLPRGQREFSKSPHMSGLDESDQMSTPQSGLGLPHIMLDWTQVQMPLRSDGIDRTVQPMLFDPSASRPYQDLDGRRPVMANMRHMNRSRSSLAITRVSTSHHPNIARSNAARSNARNLRKLHDPEPARRVLPSCFDIVSELPKGVSKHHQNA
jgi:hypothetical protein